MVGQSALVEPLRQTHRVLLIGYRKGIVQVLMARQIPYALWDPKPPKLSTAFYVLAAPIAQRASRIKLVASQFEDFAPFTHVIAGTEKAVYPASICRRLLGARPSSHLTARRCHDKWMMKKHLRACGIPMTDFKQAKALSSPEAAFQILGTPVVSKIRTQSGGRHTVICQDVETLAPRMGQNRLLERYIVGDEISVESFVQNGKILFTNITQYYRKTIINLLPAPFASDLCEAALDLNRRVIQHLNIEWGMTHVEMYLSERGLLFGEIAARPPGGYIMQLLTEAYGFNAWQAFVATELGERFTFTAQASHYTAVIILHPGEGTLSAISDLQHMKMPSVIKHIRIKAKVGDVVKLREGVGMDIGYAILVAEDLKQLHDAIHWFDSHFTMSLEGPIGLH